jgi:hypothetical protein
MQSGGFALGGFLTFFDFFANPLQHGVDARPVLWLDEQAQSFQLFLLESESPEFLIIHCKMSAGRRYPAIEMPIAECPVP